MKSNTEWMTRPKSFSIALISIVKNMLSPGTISERSWKSTSRLSNQDSVFAYDNKSFGLYCYTWDGCTPQEFDIHVKGEVKELRRFSDGEKPMPWTIQSLAPIGVRKLSMNSEEKESLFHVRIQPGDFVFFEVK